MHQHAHTLQSSEDQQQTTTYQQKAYKQSQKSGQKTIQAKHKPIQRKAKPPIQAKQQPIQAKQVPIQRMVAVANDKTNEISEFILLSHIDFARQKAGDPTGSISTLDFSAIGKDETLYLVEHGLPGSIGSLKASDVVKLLSNAEKGLPKDYAGQIVISSCFSAETEVPGFDKLSVEESLLSEVRQGLKDAGYENISLVGMQGPSITNYGASQDAQVVKPENVAKDKGTGGKTAQQVQNELVEKHGLKAKMDKQIEENPEMTLTEKAAYAAELSQGFYEEFIQRLSDEGMLKEDAKFTNVSTKD